MVAEKTKINLKFCYAMNPIIRTYNLNRNLVRKETDKSLH